MRKFYEVRVEFDTPRDLVLTLDEDDYEEYVNSDDYEILFERFEDQITDHLAGGCVIEYAKTIDVWEEDED